MTDFTSSTVLSRSARRKSGIMGYIDLYRQRRVLASLDNARLADLGLNRQEADVEAGRSFWDAPIHWK